MLPIAHVIARKRREYNDKRRTNYSPFAVNPRTGLFSVDSGATISTMTCEEIKQTETPKTANTDATAATPSPSPVSSSTGKLYKSVKKRVPVEIPFKCSDCTVDVITKRQVQKVRISMDFTPSTRHCDLYFPVSECGNIDNINIVVNGKEVTNGDIMRRGPARLGPIVRDSFEGLIPPTNAEEFEADSEDEGEKQRSGRRVDKDPSSMGNAYSIVKDAPTSSSSSTSSAKRTSGGKVQREPVVFYYHCRRLSESIAGPEGFPLGKSIKVIIEYATTIIEKEPKKRYHVAFPLVVLPKSPNLFQFSLEEMPDTIQRIIPLNRSHDDCLSPYIEGPKAEVVVGCGGDALANAEGDRSSSKLNMDPGKGVVRLTDYVFVLVVELGPPIIPRCADPVALLVIISGMAAMLFFLLTKDLEDYN